MHRRIGSSESAIGRLDDPISVLGPSDVGAVLTKTVERPTRLDLSCEIGSHPIPPSVSPNGFLSSPHPYEPSNIQLEKCSVGNAWIGC